jgi:hypothetical protein
MERVSLTTKAATTMKMAIPMTMTMAANFALETKNCPSLATTNDQAAAIAIHAA